MSPRRAFTLIEILVVLAILSVLAAMLFPAFGRSREMARRTSCANHLRQIGLGLLQYAADFDERLPPYSEHGFVGYADNNGNNADGARWADMIFPYVKSSQIFNCPDANGKMATLAGGQFFDVASYSFGYVSPSVSGEPIGVAGRSCAQIEDASGTLMVVDDGRLDANNNLETKGRIVPTMSDSLEELGVRLDGYRHTNCRLDDFQLYAFNGVFADGHVKWLPLAQTYGEGSLRMWTITTD